MEKYCRYRLTDFDKIKASYKSLENTERKPHLLGLTNNKQHKMIRQTSIDCYNEIKNNGLLSKRRLEVYEAIFKNAPCTTNEALKDIYSGSHGVGSRTTELRELGVIYEKQTRKCNVTGRVVIEWDLTDNLPKDIKPKANAKQQRKDKAIDALRELYKNQSDSEVWQNVAKLIQKI